MSTYNISKSSLLSLKAEILRKQEELSKVKKDNKVKINNLKKNAPLDLKNKGVEQRESNDYNSDEDDLLKKSRSALEAKSKLYDKLSKESNNLSEEQQEANRHYLVCFNKKTANAKDDSDEDAITEDYAPAANPDEEWVEYTDCLGRTRTCLRKDLEYLKSKDADLRRTVAEPRDKPDSSKEKEEESCNKNSESEEETKLTEENELLSSDMRREILRRQWEKEEDALRDKHDIHYQDVLFNEARTHGVGYYGFSKDEEVRAQQQEALKKLRKETEQQQRKAQELRALREKQLAARAKAARNRKRARMGLPPETEEEQETKESNEAEPIAAANAETQEKTKEEQKKEQKRKQHVRPWDVGKEGVKQHYEYTQEEWVEKKRSERVTEFAPPTAYRKNFSSKVVAEPSESSDKSLFFSTKKRNNDKDTYTRRNLNYYKESASFEPTPIVNECAEAESSHHEYDSQSMENLDDSDEDDRGKGVEIAPPPTFDYYGPSGGKKRKREHKKENLEDSIAAGLKFLRDQAEQKQKPNKRDSEMFIM